MYFKLSDILNIDGGRAYIEFKAPDSVKSFGQKNLRFKLRAAEKTASASVYQANGVWYITDFGGDGKRMNAVDFCMLEDNLGFAEACAVVAAFYKLEGAKFQEPKAHFDKWGALPNEQEGEVKISLREFTATDFRHILTDTGWNALGKTDAEKLKNAIAKATFLHCKCVEYYTLTRNGTTMKYTSTEEFPIFVIEEGDFKKIYKPLDKKEYRFFSTGERPQDLVHGLEQITKMAAEKEASMDVSFGDDNEDTAEGKNAKKDDWKLPDVTYCSGFSDAFNVFCLGYHVVFPNSETYTFTHGLWKKLKYAAKIVYQLGDIDATGLRETHKLGMEFLQMKLIRLPMSLLAKKDRRGNPCKDVRDYLNHYNKFDYKNLFETAKEYQFWDEETRYKDGKPVMKFGKPVKSFVFHNARAYNFLYWNGFCRLYTEKEKDLFMFVRITDHVVEPVNALQIRNFINDFLESRFYEDELRNVVYKSPQLGESSLSNLPMRDISFKPYGEDFQYLFFQTYNQAKAKYDSVAWRITNEGIKEQMGDVGYYVWKKKVLPRKSKVLEKFFEIAVTKAVPPLKETTYGLKIVDDRALVLKFLIQTCRVHWRLELEERLGIMSRLKTVAERNEYVVKHNLSEEDVMRIFHPANVEGGEYVKNYREKYRFSLEGEMLTEAEKEEQRISFINRVYAIGYMMHRFKNPSKPWGLWVMDGKIADETESHGGSGKSLLTLFFKNINMAMVNLDGRNTKLTANPHIFENVDASTDVVNVDDLCDYFDFNFFFAPLTSTMPVNPKNKQGFELSHSDSPKLMFSSNYGDRSTDPSSLRRKLYTIYSDYYHENNGDYRETRKPDEELGGNLFMNWADSEWELFYNFMAQCLSFYLGCEEKIMPPMGNVQKRNLISQMSEQFKAWADIYFDPEGDKVNRWVMKSEAFDDFMKQTNAMKSHTVHLFKKKLQIYCKYMRYDFNPEIAGSNIHKVDKKDDKGNYVRDKDDKVAKTTSEHVFVATSPLSRTKNEGNGGVPERVDDLPF